MRCKNLNLSLLLATLITLIGLLGILGHWFHLKRLTTFSWLGEGSEIALYTAVSFLCLGLVLTRLVCKASPPEKYQKQLVNTLTLIPMGIALFYVARYLILAELNILLPLLRIYPTVPMAFLTAVQLLLAAIGVSLWQFMPQVPGCRNTIGVIGIFLLETALFAMVGVLAQIPVLMSFYQAVPTIMAVALCGILFLSQALAPSGFLAPLLSSVKRIRCLSSLGIASGLLILIAGVAIIQVFAYLLGKGAEGLEAEKLIATFEFSTIAISILVMTLSLRVLFYYESSLQSEEEARTSEERFRLFVSGVKDYAIYMLDPQGNVISWNEGAERIQGYSRSEILGRNFALFYPESEQLAGHPQEKLKLAQKCGRLDIESWLIRKDGSGFWARCTLTSTLDSDNHLLGFSNVVRDLTVQKEMEASLRQSVFELTNIRQALDSASILAITDPNGVLTYVNQAFCDISKYTQEELIGHPHQLVHSSFHSASFFDELWQTIQSGKVWKGEICNQSKTGQLYWVDTTIYPFMTVDKQPIQYISIHHDITPLKSAQESLRGNFNKQKILTSLSQQALSGVTIDRLLDQSCILLAKTLKLPLTKVLVLNAAENQFLLQAGYGWDKGVVGHFTVPAGPESQAGYTLIVEEPVVVENFRTEDRFSQPALLKRHNVMSGMSIIIQGENPDKPFGVLGVHSREPRAYSADDVMFLQAVANIIGIAVERRHAETLLQELNLELEQRVLERTRQLEEATQVAEEANRLKTKVMAFVSHDFKNPLAAMGRFIQILRENTGQLNAQQQEIISYISDGVTQLQNMVSDILDKARMEEGRLTLSLEIINLSAFIENMKPLVEALAIDKDVQIHYEIQANIDDMEADTRFLRQIILNLISNAIKYNRPNGDIYLRAKECGDARFVSISVQDTGRGISAEQMPLLFKEYFRLGTSAYSSVEGTGLGLAFIKKLVEMHGGDISVRSELEQGSTFTILLPKRAGLAWSVLPDKREELLNEAQPVPLAPEAAVES
jgi:PAS domain S-box-containing protein